MEFRSHRSSARFVLAEVITSATKPDGAYNVACEEPAPTQPCVYKQEVKGNDFEEGSWRVQVLKLAYRRRGHLEPYGEMEKSQS